MTTFQYKGITAAGAKVSGVIRAYDEYEAVTQLRETCSVVTHIEAVPETKNGKTKKLRLKDKELAVMCSQFSIILNAGLPIVRCVELVAQQAKNKDLQRMLEKVAEDIDAGYSMAQSFENNCRGLPMTFIETVRAGEMSGTLEACFARLHRYYDKSAKTKAKVVSTLTYPAIVVVVAVIVFLLIMLVAVPKFKLTFEEMGVELPLVTRLLIGVSDFFVGYWWIVVGLIVILLAVRIILRRTENGRLTLDGAKLKWLPLHNINQMNACAQFAAAMSTVIAAGMPVNKALAITGAVVDNYAFGSAVLKVRDRVEQGYSISDCMAADDCFPKLLTEMTGVGEQSGSMEATMDVIGDYYTNEVNVATERLLSMMEPVITIGLAVITVVLLLAVYLPMFSMYGSI